MSEDPDEPILLQMFLDWQQAIRVAQAAQNDIQLKEARFKGAAELVHGSGASFEYKDGRLSFQEPPADDLGVVKSSVK